MKPPPYILVAEDDPDSTFLLQHVLTQASPGLKAVYTVDGKQAIDLLQVKHEGGPQPRVPDLLILDLKMPRMDGLEVLEWLQRCPALRPKYIVILTCSPSPLDIERARELGADFYVVKPVGLPELLEIARVLVGICESGRWPHSAKTRTAVRPLRAD